MLNHLYKERDNSMSAKNRVISGDYAGKQIVGGGIAQAGIVIGIVKKIFLNNTTVENYEVLGGLAGAISSKNGYQVSVQFKDGKKSLLEVDENIYKAIVQGCF